MVRCGRARSGRVFGLAVVAVVALVASGCLSADVSLQIEEDRSGELRAEVIPPVEVAGAIASAGVENLVESAIDGIDGAAFDVEDRNGLDTYIVTVPFRDYRSLTDDLTDGATVAGNRIAPFSRFDLRELPDGGWQLDAVTNPLAAAAAFPAGSPLAALAQLAASEDAGSGVELSITLPGKLIGSNADSRHDDTAVWRLEDPDATYTLRMRTEEDPLLDPLQWVLVGLLAVLAVGAALMFVGATGPARRRDLFNRSRDESDAFLHRGTGDESAQLPSGRKARRRARRNRKLVAPGRTGWVDPLAHQPVDPASPAEGEARPQPHRPLPPITGGSAATPGAPAGPGSAEPGMGFPDSSPSEPGAVSRAHDPAHMQRPSEGEAFVAPEPLLPGPAEAADLRDGAGGHSSDGQDEEPHN